MRHNHRIARVGLGLVVVMAMSGRLLGADQPAATDAATVDSPAAATTGAAEPNTDRARAREFLQRRLDGVRRQQERLERALRMMDDGKTLEDVRNAFPELARSAGGREEGMRGVDGGPGRPGRGGDDREANVDQLGPVQLPGPGPSGRTEGANPGNARGEAPAREGPPREGPGSPRGPEMAGRGPRAGDGERDAGRAISSEQRQEVIDFLAVASPELAGRLRELEAADAETARVRLGEAFMRLRPVLELRRSEPRLYELRLQDIRHGRSALDAAREVAELEHAGQASGGDDARVLEAKQRLRLALKSQYQARTELMTVERDRGRDRLSKMSLDVDARAGREQDVVERNLSALVERERKRLKGGKNPRPEQREAVSERGDRTADRP